MKHVFLSTVGERRETKYITLSLMRSMSTKRFMKKTKIATKRQEQIMYTERDDSIFPLIFTWFYRLLAV